MGIIYIQDIPGRGGGGTQVQRGAAPALRISRKEGSFLRPPHVRDFVKEGYFFVPRYEVWGQNLPTIHEIYAALTPSDSRSDWASSLLPPLAAAKHAEDYKLKLKYEFPFIQCQCFDKRRGVYSVEKISVLLI